MLVGTVDFLGRPWLLTKASHPTWHNVIVFTTGSEPTEATSVFPKDMSQDMSNTFAVDNTIGLCF